jgi:hypothetical protein
MTRQSEESSARKVRGMTSKQALSNAWYCVAVGHGRNPSSNSTGTLPIFPHRNFSTGPRFLTSLRIDSMRFGIVPRLVGRGSVCDLNVGNCPILVKSAI